MKFTKEDEGKIIYGIPTGNNASRRAVRQDIVLFKVKKIKRKYVDLCRIEEDGREWGLSAYDPESGATQRKINAGYGMNAGYAFFRSEDDVKKHYKEQSMRNEIVSFFNWRSFPLTFDDISTIYEIIKDKK
jgi:hypothetical protein